MYEIACYVDDRYVTSYNAATLDEAKLAALDAWRFQPLAEVTIYGKNGDAVRGWFKRPAPRNK